MSLLSDSEFSSDERTSGVRLKVNEKFAQRFEQAERTKDLHRAKELLKTSELDDDESDSESETEDEDAEQLSTGLDLKIIQTINSLRKKDPKIYDPNAKWFDDPETESSDEDEEAESASKKKKKFKDVLREQLLQTNMDDGDGIEDATGRVGDTASRKRLVYDAEQERIRQAFLKSASGKDAKSSSRNTEESSDEEDDVLQVKTKSAQEVREEEIALQKALQEMKELAARTEKKEQAKQDKGKTVVLELEEDESFLENYLEKQMWKDKSGQSQRSAAAQQSDEEDLEEDEEELEEMERFESKYNFRFEELQDQAGGGAVEVQGHARDVQGSMRRTEDKRKTQRESRKERKEKERRQQEAELRRLKNLKRQELRERLKQISKMGGLEGLGFEDDLVEADEEEQGGEEAAGPDAGATTTKKSRRGGKRARKEKNKVQLDEEFLDEDWDPEKHEALMAAQFGDEYYEQEDTDFNVADLDNAEAYERYLGDDGVGDVDYDDEDGHDAAANLAPDKQQALAALRKSAAEMEEELYQLDYEDIVAGLPCRFKYKQVEKEDFGLTTEDILFAEDAELNKYVSLKKISAYTHHSGVNDADLSKKRKRLRESVKERMARLAEEAEKAGQQLKGTKPKEKAPEAVDEEEEGAEDAAEEAGHVDGEGKKRKRRRRKGTSSATDTAPQLITKQSVEAATAASGHASSAAQKDRHHEAHQAGGDGEKKKKHKKSSKKREETPQERRMNLYR